jgi:antitoxin component YwqK of YwqJK toxin-antitoxin module
MNIINLSPKKSSSSIFFIIIGIALSIVFLISFLDEPTIKINIDTDESGKMIREYQYYKQGKFTFNHGFYYSYFPNGTKKETRFFKHGKRDSIWIYFDDKERMITEESWENGRLIERIFYNVKEN